MEEKIYNVLTENEKHSDFYKKIFEKYLNAGYNIGNIPIPPLYFDNVASRNNNIFINENVYKQLEEIQDRTSQTNYEIPFCLLGYEQADGKIIFFNILKDTNNNSRLEANFDNIVPTLEAYLENLDLEKGRPIICKGHSHGQGNVSDNFSFGDLISAATFKNNIKDYIRSINSQVSYKDIDTVNLLLNPCGDFNFIYYEDRPMQTGFYKFTNIFLRTNDNKIYLLPTMSENGNYIRKDTRTR